MGIGKQAKILTDRQMRTALAYVGENHRYPLRDRVMILLSFKAGLRAKEIAAATWAMVVTADGTVGDVLSAYPSRANSTQKGLANQYASSAAPAYWDRH